MRKTHRPDKPTSLLKPLIPLLLAALLLLPALATPAPAAEARRVEVKAREVAATEHRIALVIGNAAYRVGALRNPANDARAVAAALRELGFQVEERTDLSYQEMGRAIVRFGQGIRRDSVALFYYAGHGLQVQGSNYLVPVDAQIHDEGEVPFATVNAGLVLAKMEEARNPVNIVILDACRDNPYVRTWKRSSGGRGLAKMDAPVGSIIAYAAGPGETADDGKGKNGLYTESLVRQMKAPGLKIEDVFKRVRTEVRQRSGGRQIPAETTQLEGDFYFAPGSAVAAPAPQPPPPLAMARPPEPPPAPAAPAAPRAGEIVRDPVTGMEMVFVPGGCFKMGDSTGDGEADEKPVHEVYVRDLYVGRTEVTVGQFKRFVAETGYQTDAERNAGGVNGCLAYDQDNKAKNWTWRDWASWKTPNKYQENRDDHPVSCVSWNDARAFADWLSRKGGPTYRLPTEAEWEYAARGGTTTRNYWGDGKEDACAYANVADRTPLPNKSTWTRKYECSDGYAFAAPVGRFKPNAFGLYDTIGNLWEWTADWFGKDYYADSPRENPPGPASGSSRVSRGGGWDYGPGPARAALRGRFPPEGRYSFIGFRLVRTP